MEMKAKAHPRQIPEVEYVKRLHMVEFLNRYYGLDFSNSNSNSISHGKFGRHGRQYCCLSPFTKER